MKQTGKQRWMLAMLIGILTMTLFSMMAFATGNDSGEAGKGTDTLPGQGLMSDAESMLDGIESDLTGTDTGKDTAKDTNKDTDRVTGSVTTNAGDSLTGTADGEDGGGVGLVIGIGVAVVALIIVFVILSRSSGGGKK